MTQPSLSDLRAFVTVGEQRSFAAAAKALHLSQPALSRRIAHLEHMLGVRLFDRTTRSVQLTLLGERFLGEVRGLPPLPRPVCEVRHVSTLIGLVENGLGVAVVPRLTLPHESSSIVGVKLERPVVHRTIGVIQRRAAPYRPPPRRSPSWSPARSPPANPPWPVNCAADRGDAHHCNRAPTLADWRHGNEAVRPPARRACANAARRAASRARGDGELRVRRVARAAAAGACAGSRREGAGVLGLVVAPRA